MTDTTKKAQKIQVEIFRNMKPEERLTLGLELLNTTLELLRAGIRMRHPDYSDKDVDCTLKKLILSEKLYAKVYLNGQCRNSFLE
jgi:hypothetical protein